MSLFIPLRKVDAAQRMVYGQIDETPDRAGEVFDYKSSKRHFQTWSRSVRKATDGKSLGNVRAMHGAVAAGKLESIQFDDEARCIQLVARIVDDAEWQKVEQGVYTGFSPGGRYIKRWRDGAYTRYTAEPSEISIVDLPCIPSASFTMVKVDGAEVEVPFADDGADPDADDDAAVDSDEDGDGQPATYSREHLAELLASLDWLDGGDWVEDWSVNGRPIADDLRDWLEEGADLVATYLDDSQEEDGSSDGNDFAASARPRGLMKMQRDLETLRKSLGRLSGERDQLKARVSALESQPRPGGPVLKAVSKGDDVAALGLSDQMRAIETMEDGDAKTLALIKLAHQQPKTFRF
jgi:hypothetical protein